MNINMPPRRKVIVEKETKQPKQPKQPKRKMIVEKEEAKYIKAPKLVVSKKNGQYKIFASIPEDKKMIELKY